MPTKKKRLRSLSIFLLREGMTDEQALRAPDEVEAVSAPSGTANAIVYLKPQATRRPWWVAYLMPHVASAEELRGIANASSAALLMLRAGDRRLAIAFGYGRHLLMPESFEHDFGLKVVLNTVDADALRSIDSRTFDEMTTHTRRDLSLGSGITAFGLDLSRDLLRAVTGPPRDESLGARASGADALALNTRAQFEELPDLCARLLEAYESDEYRERFAFIDHLRVVRDAAKIGELDSELVQALRQEQLIDVHLAPPEPLDWQRIEGFAYSTAIENELDVDPRITSYLGSVEDSSDITVSRLKGDVVYAVGTEGSGVSYSWSVYRCLVFETREGDVLYALTGGHWYAVAESFADEVIDFARALPTLNLELPNAELGAHEGDYNISAAESLGLLCLDQQLVRTPVGDRIELCDLLSPARQLIHVKKRGDSSTLSHLFSQGLVSGELLVREQEFRREARRTVRELDPAFEDSVPDDPPDSGGWEVSFAVISRSNRDTPLTLPFFSLVNLRTAALRLGELRYRVSIKLVPEGD